MATTSESAILIGLQAETGEPIHVDRGFLASTHTHIRGRTGAGKTSRAILPLILQLMGHAPSDGPPESIFIFDLGGDRGLFHCVRDAARHAGRVFRFLSLNADDDWHYFDPFQAASKRREQIIDLAEMLIEAFSMEYGPIYGGQYFTQQNLRALLRVAEHLVKQKSSATDVTIDDIARFLEKNQKRIPDSDQIRAMFDFLCQYPQLKPHLAPSREEVIDLKRALENGEVIYFFLPTIGKTITVRPIAGLALYSLQQLAMRRPEEGLPSRRAWVFIDEFQSIAGRSFENFLVQCRKFQMSMFLCHQSLDQLKTKDSTLDQIVAKNTSLRMFFTAEGQDEIDELQAMSRTTRVILHGKTTQRSEQETKGNTRGYAFTVSQFNAATNSSAVSSSQSRGESVGMNEREQIMPELEVNEIQDVSATDGQYFLVVNTGNGHMQPTAVQGLHLLLPASHFRAANMPLPKRPNTPSAGDTPEAIESIDKETAPAVPTPATPPRDPDRQQRLTQLWQAVEATLQWADLPIVPKRQ
jgi:hypothetical protein